MSQFDDADAFEAAAARAPAPRPSLSARAMGIGAQAAPAYLDGLNPAQRAAVEALDGPVLLLAGAGTGKTRAITHRIAYGVASGVFDPHRTLALTFTARAAAEMRTRLRDLGVAGVQARTFHSAALRQLQYFWPQAVGGPMPSLIENKVRLLTEVAQRMRMTVDRAGLRDLAGEIEWAKVSLHAPEGYAEAAKEREMPAGWTAIPGPSFAAAKMGSGTSDRATASPSRGDSSAIASFPACLVATPAAAAPAELAGTAPPSIAESVPLPLRNFISARAAASSTVSPCSRAMRSKSACFSSAVR